MNILIRNDLKRFRKVLLLSAISAIAVLSYFDKTFSNSIIALLLCVAFFCVWKHFPFLETKRFYIYNGIFTFLFALSMAIGRKLDFDLPIRGGNLFLSTLGLFCAFYPVVAILTKKLEDYKAEGTEHNRFRQKCFLFIALSWLAGYLAVFPGIYTNDAPYWYRDFDDPARSVSSKWSPVYAGLFYAFVHTGKVLFHNYECGLALFTAMQSVFILVWIRKILIFIQSRMGNTACILTTLFFVLVPTHLLMAMQTAQGAPFMVCFAMVMIHLHRMVVERDEYWQNYKNYVAFIIWSIGACLLRNNAYYVFVLFLICVPLYHKEYRKKLLFTIATVIAVTTIYNGPILDIAGVSKGTSLQESLSMPLQQMACVYVQYPHKLTWEQKKQLEQYVPPKALKQYSNDASISDVQKGNLNLELVRQDFSQFISLYINIGINAPIAYLKAAYMQNLGMFYIDKRYQDTRIWHNLIDYISYDMRNPVYIKIERTSWFPLYDKYLGKLFGKKVNKNTLYTGGASETEVDFSSIPVLSIFCRVSTYFWCLVYFLIFAAYKKYKEDFLYLSFAALFTLSVIFGPVILYRYYAPVIFAFPVIIAALFGTRKNVLLS